MQTRSFWQRIAVLTLGLLIVAGLGLLHAGRMHNWLIETKGESLRVQGEVVAAFIAASVPDPDGPPESGGIPPERVAPILRRLLPGPVTRARVYAHDGTLLVDTARLLSRGQEDHQGRGVINSAWARILCTLMRTEPPVYRETGGPGGSGGAPYPEVRTALSGSATSALFVIENGEPVVSVAVPIQRRTAVQGVLLLSARVGT